MAKNKSKIINAATCEKRIQCQRLLRFCSRCEPHCCEYTFCLRSCIDYTVGRKCASVEFSHTKQCDDIQFWFLYAELHGEESVKQRWA